MEKIKEESYRIKVKFGKSIVDQDDKQIAWVENYVLAKEVCMFLNKNRKISLYPTYVRIGSDCYKMRNNVYYSDKLKLEVDFTIKGDKLISASNRGVHDGILIKECRKETWLLDNVDYFDFLD